MDAAVVVAGPWETIQDAVVQRLLDGDSCTIALSVASFTSVSTYIRQSCYSSLGLPWQGITQEVGYLKDPTPHRL